MAKIKYFSAKNSALLHLHTLTPLHQTASAFSQALFPPRDLPFSYRKRQKLALP
jgi:hypothetical protein